MKSGVLAYPYNGTGPFLERKALGYVDAIKRASKLGFKGVGGIIRSKDMNSAAIRKIRDTAKSLDIEITEFIETGNPDLSDESKEVRDKGIKYFRESVQMASEIGTKVINTTSHNPFPYKERIDFNATTINVDIPAGFDWDEVWERYVETVGRCADIVSDADLLWAIEHHPFQIVDNTNMDLKLIEDVGSKVVGVCYDTAQDICMGEIPEISIYKLKGRIWHTHISDNLGSLVSPRHMMLGKGKINWGNVLKAFKDVGYDGFLTLEITDSRQTAGWPLSELDEANVNAMAFLRDLAKERGIKIEWNPPSL